METEELVVDAVTVEPEPAKPDLRKTWIISGAVAFVALCGAIVGVKALDTREAPLVAAANAANGAFMNRPTAGKITAIDGSSFTVKTTNLDGSTSDVTVNTSQDTTYREQVDGKLSDLKVGDSVMATGTTTDGVFTATRINEADVLRLGGAPPVLNGGEMSAPPEGVIAPAPQGRQFFSAGADGSLVGGEIKSIEGDTLVVSGFDGSDTTIKTTATTTFRVTKTIARQDLKVGDTVRVQGDTAGDTVTADNVTKGSGDGPFFAR